MHAPGDAPQCLAPSCPSLLTRFPKHARLLAARTLCSARAPVHRLHNGEGQRCVARARWIRRRARARGAPEGSARARGACSAWRGCACLPPLSLARAVRGPVARARARQNGAGFLGSARASLRVAPAPAPGSRHPGRRPPNIGPCGCRCLSAVACRAAEDCASGIAFFSVDAPHAAFSLHQAAMRLTCCLLAPCHTNRCSGQGGGQEGQAGRPQGRAARVEHHLVPPPQDPQAHARPQGAAEVGRHPVPHGPLRGDQVPAHHRVGHEAH